MATVTAVEVSPSRSADLDVVRAIALIGVCVMNYHGYLNGAAAADDSSFWGSLFDPWSGPLSTRFAATFVLVAGMGVAMMGRRALASKAAGVANAVSETRITLVRRGVLLLAVGYVFDWIWPGTILFFYGGLFAVAALLVTLRTAWIATIGTAAAVAAALIAWWSTRRDLSWLVGGSSELTMSPRDLLFDLVVRGTHPLLPWLAFFCAGMVLARTLPADSESRALAALGGAAAVAAAYALREFLPGSEQVLSTNPGSRGMLYTVSALGSAVTAVVVIGALARATSQSSVTRALAVAGRCTLTLYVLHAFAYNALVRMMGLVDRDSGLGAALAIAAAYWVVAVAAAVLWTRVARLGPLEWLYRRFSDQRAPLLVRSERHQATRIAVDAGGNSLADA